MEEIDIHKIAEEKKKKKAVTLYLDPDLIEDTREFLGNKKSVSQFVNDMLQQISDFLKERKKEQQEKKEENKSG
jgi:hypothetical protein